MIADVNFAHNTNKKSLTMRNFSDEINMKKLFEKKRARIFRLFNEIRSERRRRCRLIGAIWCYQGV